MGLYKKPKPYRTRIERNESTEGETIEMKLHRIVHNKEAIKDGAPPIYTERKDGVIPAYDIRADRMEIAQDAMDKIHKTDIAKRQERISNSKKEIEEYNRRRKEDNESKKQSETGQEKIIKNEPTQGTNDNK